MKSISNATKLTLLLLSTLTMMANVAVVTVLPHLSTLFKEVPHIELLSRLMITLPSLAIALLSPVLAPLINRFGKQRSALLALLLFCFFGTAGLYLDSIYTLLASRFLLGVAIAIVMIVATTLVGDYFKAELRNKYMGLQSAFMSLGGIIFIIGGGWLSDLNWRLPFAIYFIGIVIFILVFKYLYDPKEEHKLIEEEAHLLNHNLWYIYLLAFILMLVFYILPTQMPFLIMNVFHANGSLTGAIIAMAFIFNAVGALTFVKLKKHFKHRTIYIIGMGVMAFGFMIIGHIHNVYLFFLSSPIMGLGGGILMANMSTWMLSVAHHTKRLNASSYLTSALFLGQFASPIATHSLVSHFGVQHFFILSAWLLFIAIICALILLRFGFKKV